jgi:hypothetical protein
MRDLHKLLEQVTDKNTFLQFVEALIADRKEEVEKEKTNPSNSYSSGANGWENGTIEQYLESSVAWAKASPTSLKQENLWKSFAEFLYMGKIYE